MHFAGQRLLSSSFFTGLFLVSYILTGCASSDKNEIAKGNDSSSVFNIKEVLGEDEWYAPRLSSLPDNDFGNQIRYGRDLISNTGKYFGPKGKVNHLANGMNCQNCHLNAGTKLWANSFSAVFSIYPKFRPRSGSIETLEKRINDCMERSMNGGKIDSLSKEMRAMVAYINWVGKDVAKGVSPEGASVVDLPKLNRAANPEKGKEDYRKHCVSCHGEDGLGKLNDDNITYLYPPLWGKNSYNDAAGLFRLSRFAGFIKSNMPNLTSTHDKPTLSDEEAWDIAAYVNNMARPEKKFPRDWPDISKKPFDHPFGPFADKFPEQQHKYGPFKPIIEASKKK